MYKCVYIRRERNRFVFLFVYIVFFWFLSKVHDLSRIRMYGYRSTQLNLLLTTWITIGWLMRTFITKQKRGQTQKKTDAHRCKVNKCTFQVLFRSNDIVHEMQLNERNKPALGSILNVYIWHKYDKVDRLMLEVRPMRSYYRPRERDNAMVEMYLECPHVNTNRNRIQSDVWWQHRLLYLEGCFHFCHTKQKRKSSMYFFVRTTWKKRAFLCTVIF